MSKGYRIAVVFFIVLVFSSLYGGSIELEIRKIESKPLNLSFAEGKLSGDIPLPMSAEEKVFYFYRKDEKVAGDLIEAEAGRLGMRMKGSTYQEDQVVIDSGMESSMIPNNFYLVVYGEGDSSLIEVFDAYIEERKRTEYNAGWVRGGRSLDTWTPIGYSSKHGMHIFDESDGSKRHIERKEEVAAGELANPIKPDEEFEVVLNGRIYSTGDTKEVELTPGLLVKFDAKNHAPPGGDTIRIFKSVDVEVRNRNFRWDEEIVIETELAKITIEGIEIQGYSPAEIDLRGALGEDGVLEYDSDKGFGAVYSHPLNLSLGETVMKHQSRYEGMVVYNDSGTEIWRSGLGGGVEEQDLTSSGYTGVIVRKETNKNGGFSLEMKKDGGNLPPKKKLTIDIVDGEGDISDQYLVNFDLRESDLVNEPYSVLLRGSLDSGNGAYLEYVNDEGRMYFRNHRSDLNAMDGNPTTDNSGIDIVPDGAIYMEFYDEDMNYLGEIDSENGSYPVLDGAATFRNDGKGYSVDIRGANTIPTKPRGDIIHVAHTDEKGLALHVSEVRFDIVDSKVPYVPLTIRGGLVRDASSYLVYDNKSETLKLVDSDDENFEWAGEYTDTPPGESDYGRYPIIYDSNFNRLGVIDETGGKYVIGDTGITIINNGSWYKVEVEDPGEIPEGGYYIHHSGRNGNNGVDIGPTINYQPMHAVRLGVDVRDMSEEELTLTGKMGYGDIYRYSVGTGSEVVRKNDNFDGSFEAEGELGSVANGHYYAIYDENGDLLEALDGRTENETYEFAGGIVLKAFSDGGFEITGERGKGFEDHVGNYKIVTLSKPYGGSLNPPDILRTVNLKLDYTKADIKELEALYKIKDAIPGDSMFRMKVESTEGGSIGIPMGSDIYGESSFSSTGNLDYILSGKKMAYIRNETTGGHSSVKIRKDGKLNFTMALEFFIPQVYYDRNMIELRFEGNGLKEIGLTKWSGSLVKDVIITVVIEDLDKEVLARWRIVIEANQAPIDVMERYHIERISKGDIYEVDKLTYEDDQLIMDNFEVVTHNEAAIIKEMYDIDSMMEFSYDRGNEGKAWIRRVAENIGKNELYYGSSGFYDSTAGREGNLHPSLFQNLSGQENLPFAVNKLNDVDNVELGLYNVFVDGASLDKGILLKYHLPNVAQAATTIWNPLILVRAYGLEESLDVSSEYTLGAPIILDPAIIQEGIVYREDSRYRLRVEEGYLGKSIRIDGQEERLNSSGDLENPITFNNGNIQAKVEVKGGTFWLTIERVYRNVQSEILIEIYDEGEAILRTTLTMETKILNTHELSIDGRPGYEGRIKYSNKTGGVIEEYNHNFNQSIAGSPTFDVGTDNYEIYDMSGVQLWNSDLGDHYEFSKGVGFYPGADGEFEVRAHGTEEFEGVAGEYRVAVVESIGGTYDPERTTDLIEMTLDITLGDVRRLDGSFVIEEAIPGVGMFDTPLSYSDGGSSGTDTPGENIYGRSKFSSGEDMRFFREKNYNIEVISNAGKNTRGRVRSGRAEVALDRYDSGLERNQMYMEFGRGQMDSIGLARWHGSLRSDAEVEVKITYDHPVSGAAIEIAHWKIEVSANHPTTDIMGAHYIKHDPFEELYILDKLEYRWGRITSLEKVKIEVYNENAITTSIESQDDRMKLSFSGGNNAFIKREGLWVKNLGKLDFGYESEVGGETEIEQEFPIKDNIKLRIEQRGDYRPGLYNLHNRENSPQDGVSVSFEVPDGSEAYEYKLKIPILIAAYGLQESLDINSDYTMGSKIRMESGSTPPEGVVYKGDRRYWMRVESTFSGKSVKVEDQEENLTTGGALEKPIEFDNGDIAGRIELSGGIFELTLEKVYRNTQSELPIEIYDGGKLIVSSTLEVKTEVVNRHELSIDGRTGYEGRIKYSNKTGGVIEEYNHNFNQSIAGSPIFDVGNDNYEIYDMSGVQLWNSDLGDHYEFSKGVGFYPGADGEFEVRAHGTEDFEGVAGEYRVAVVERIGDTYDPERTSDLIEINLDITLGDVRRVDGSFVIEGAIPGVGMFDTPLSYSDGGTSGSDTPGENIYGRSEFFSVEDMRFFREENYNIEVISNAGKNTRGRVRSGRAEVALDRYDSGLERNRMYMEFGRGQMDSIGLAGWHGSLRSDAEVEVKITYAHPVSKEVIEIAHWNIGVKAAQGDIEKMTEYHLNDDGIGVLEIDYLEGVLPPLLDLGVVEIEKFSEDSSIRSYSEGAGIGIYRSTEDIYIGDVSREIERELGVLKIGGAEGIEEEGAVGRVEVETVVDRIAPGIYEIYNQSTGSGELGELRVFNRGTTETREGIRPVRVGVRALDLKEVLIFTGDKFIGRDIVLSPDESMEGVEYNPDSRYDFKVEVPYRGKSLTVGSSTRMIRDDGSLESSIVLKEEGMKGEIDLYEGRLRIRVDEISNDLSMSIPLTVSSEGEEVVTTELSLSSRSGVEIVSGRLEFGMLRPGERNRIRTAEIVVRSDAEVNRVELGSTKVDITGGSTKIEAELEIEGIVPISKEDTLVVVRGTIPAVPEDAEHTDYGGGFTLVVISDEE